MNGAVMPPIVPGPPPRGHPDFRHGAPAEFRLTGKISPVSFY
jgi:hypothetical protein